MKKIILNGSTKNWLNMIPKIIWQSYEDSYKDLPEYVTECTQTWIDNNPDWEYNYMNANDRELFVLKNFGKEWFNLFMSCPVNIMRADIWRYMIIYKYGGAYVDVSTRCKQPLNILTKYKHKTILCVDTDKGFFSQSSFLSEPGTKIFENVLNDIFIALKKADYSERHFVHKITGPAIWTRSIKKTLDLKQNFNIYQNYNDINSLDISKKYGVFCYGNNINTSEYMKTIVKHSGNAAWTDGRYIQWTKQVPYVFDMNSDITDIIYDEDLE